MNLKIVLIWVSACVCSVAFSQRKYTVKATNGLIIRQGPSTQTERTGKLPYGHKFEIKEENVSDKFSLTENDIEIKGHWVRIESEFGNGYVFDGFTSRDYDVKGYGYRVYGKVKSYKKHTFYNGGMQNADWYEFNEKGEMIKDYYYNSRDKAWEVATIKIYNKKGQLTERNGRYDIHSYKFDKKGNEVEDYVVKKDGTPYSKTTRTFDKKGNPTSTTYYYFKNKTGHKWVYKYNDQNKYLETKHYDKNDELDGHYVFDYKNDTILMSVHKIKPDGTKRITSKRTFEKSSQHTVEKFVEYFKEDKKAGEIYKSHIKEFDQDNNLIKEEIFESAESQPVNFSFSGGGGNYDERTIKYYQNNELVNKKLYRKIYFENKDQELLVGDYNYKKNYLKEINNMYYSDSVEKYIDIKYYNYNGQLVKHLDYDNSDSKTIYEYQYTYDLHGNWTLKKVFRNGRFYRDYFQEFEYYE